MLSLQHIPCEKTPALYHILSNNLQDNANKWQFINGIQLLCFV